MQNSAFWNRISSLYGSQTSSVVFACKTAHFGTEFQVSMGPRPHLWFLPAKQRILEQNFKSLWVPDLICGFCLQNSAFRTRISSLYGSHISSVVLRTHNSVLSTRMNRLYWFALTCGFVHGKQRLLDPINKSLWVPDITCRFMHTN